jgi:ubiquinone/menaquinone biosynthesis C-methylase UbiE
MNDDTTNSPSTYLVGYGREMHADMSRRTVTSDADFLLSYLRPGMRVLDCGSGPGSITLGLAGAVAPGEVLGIDIAPVQVERASALAAERGIENVRFELGDIHALPFADGSFDVAWANTVLMHFCDPVPAVREMRRVVRPGGIVAVRDLVTIFREPVTPMIERYHELLAGVSQVTLGRSTPGFMRHKAVLLEAGLRRVEGFTDTTTRGNPESMRENAALTREFLASEQLRRNAARAGFDDAALDLFAAEFDDWHARPDAMVVVVWSAGLGWVD